MRAPLPYESIACLVFTHLLLLVGLSGIALCSTTCLTFCGVSIDEFHRISHVKTAKKAFSLTNSYGMHLVILAHLSLF